MTQEQYSTAAVQSPSDTGATTPAEARVHAQMSELAKRFATLFDWLPYVGLVHQVMGKPFERLVISAANVYSVPSTQEMVVQVATPGSTVRVYAQVVGQALPTGNSWYRISKPSEPPRYINAELVIQGNLHQALEQYFQLATLVWEAAAAERIDDLVRTTTYQAAVATLEQYLTSLGGLCKSAQPNPSARATWGWSWRVQLYRRSLEEWLRCLDDQSGMMLSDLTESGRTLYHARGRLGLAGGTGFDYICTKSVQGLGIAFCLALLVLIPFLIGEPIGTSTVKVLTLSVLLLAAPYLWWLNRIGLTLPIILGYALARKPSLDTHPSVMANQTSPQASRLSHPLVHACSAILRKIWEGSLSYWLRIWSVIGGAGFLLLSFVMVGSAAQEVQRNGDPIFNGVFFPIIVLGLYYFIAFFWIVLPFTLKMQTNLWRELHTHPQRPPAARRAAVRPALKLLSLHYIGFLAVAIPVVSGLSFAPAWRFLADPLSPVLPSFITLGQLVYLLGVLLLYLLLLEFPYRGGVRRWKAHRLHELTTLRKQFDRRLSQVPSQPTDQQKSTSLQDDYARWQYYRAQEEDVKQAPLAPLSLVQRGWVLVLTVATSFLLDQLKTFVGSVKPPFHP